LVATVTVLLLPASTFAQLPGPLDADVRRAVFNRDLGASRVGIVLMDPADGAPLAEFNETDAFIPASNMKLYTSGVALSVLGDDFAFETTLSLVPAATEHDPPNLLVTGSGDPGFADPELLKAMDLTVDDLVDVWVEAVEQTGVGTFGEIIVDTRVFDDEVVHPDWPVDALNKWYCAEVSGLNFHANLVHVHTKPSGVGEPPIVHLEPDAPGIRVTNRARTIAKGPHNAWAARELGTNNLTLFADVRRSSQPIEVAITDGASVFGAYFRSRLRDAGIDTAPPRLAERTETFADAQPLHVIRTPMRTVLRRCNQDSYNLYAEALLKRVAHEVTGSPGSWAQGSAVMQMMIQERLERAGVGAVHVADGSGMSRSNRVTPMAVAEWLTAMREDEAIWAAFRDSLATPGAGTAGVRRLGRRGFQNSLYAKSGFLNGVHAMSGFLVDDETGRTVVFAMILNDRPTRGVPMRTITGLFADVAEVADDWLTEQAAAELAREGDRRETRRGFGG
jgi:D-alanyl-D-alanine carboxypeptidase/D-alanyl-D-alanine-endopeptidase (penicillin-binding protein 4)